MLGRGGGKSPFALKIICTDVKPLLQTVLPQILESLSGVCMVVATSGIAVNSLLLLLLSSEITCRYGNFPSVCSFSSKLNGYNVAKLH